MGGGRKTPTHITGGRDFSGTVLQDPGRSHMQECTQVLHRFHGPKSPCLGSGEPKTILVDFSIKGWEAMSVVDSVGHNRHIHGQWTVDGSGQLSGGFRSLQWATRPLGH